MTRHLGYLMMFLTCIWCSAASAAERAVTVGVGTVTNDPFVNRHAVTVGGQYRPQAHVAFGVDVRYFPDLGDSDWKGLAKQLVEENHVSPDISKMMYSGTVNLGLFPLSTTKERFAVESRVGVLVSAGVVKTEDDLSALDTDSGDDRAEATQHQVHPCGGVALVGDFWWGINGLRLRREQIIYIEVVNSTTLEMKNNSLLIAEYGRRF
jgi:hypothetical protein